MASAPCFAGLSAASCNWPGLVLFCAHRRMALTGHDGAGNNVLPNSALFAIFAKILINTGFYGVKADDLQKWCSQYNKSAK
ncbi:MAG: hypothetical protein PHO83_02425 [Geobacteraceae bacterium]|nr:hypothetical protein [Geobacteraceae bacterium]